MAEPVAIEPTGNTQNSDDSAIRVPTADGAGA